MKSIKEITLQIDDLIEKSEITDKLLIKSYLTQIRFINGSEQIKNKMKKRQDITQYEYNCLMGDVYSENIDLWILESKKKSDKDWFKTLDRIIQYILYNIMGIEIIEEPETKLQKLAKEYLKDVK